MKADEIREYCLGFPDATENLQWGDDLCFKIRGKIFAIVGLDNPRLCFKCAPDVFAELIEREDIHPAPYVGRYKWVMADRLDALAAAEIRFGAAWVGSWVGSFDSARFARLASRVSSDKATLNLACDLRVNR